MTEIDVAVIKSKLEEMSERLTDLAKNYRVLNECHQGLELRMAALETELKTYKSILRLGFTVLGIGLTALQIILRFWKA